MSQKKNLTGSKLPSGGKSKQTSTPTKSKSVEKQTTPAAAASSSNSTATVVDSPEDTSSVQDYILFWLDLDINPEDDGFRTAITQLQSIIDTIHLFDDVDACINMLNTIKKHKVLMVVVNDLDQQILSRIHGMHQLTAIFMFVSNESIDESQTKSYHKVKGIFTNPTALYESVKEVTRQCNEDSIDISLIPAGDISDQLDQSFMYTQLIKEILLELPYNDESVSELVTYYRPKYSTNANQLQVINSFKDMYTTKSPIWWYTYECFIYHQLNWALREQEVDVIIRMAFFVCDLLRHIERLHQEQSKRFQKEFTVYRGQGMLPEKFEQLKKTKGGLISFNVFLSTSLQETVGMHFAEMALDDPSHVAVLFFMNVNPSVSSVPFASIDHLSYYQTEAEILFSMHSIFRINDIQKSDTDDRLWCVYLSSASNSDKQIVTLIERMRLEIEGPSALYRLGALMMKLGEFDKAEEVYNNLRRRTFDELEKGNIYYQLGHIKDSQGKYEIALGFYQQALKIYQDKLPSNHSNIATCYNNIGLAHDNMGDHPTALSFYEKALSIYQETLSPDHENIATSYSSIGLIYNTMGDHAKAFSYCSKALEIFQNKLSSNHPLVAASYNNLGLVYANMKKYPEAISSYKRAVEIGQLVLPPNHPHLTLYKQNLESLSKTGKK